MDKLKTNINTEKNTVNVNGQGAHRTAKAENAQIPPTGGANPPDKEADFTLQFDGDSKIYIKPTNIENTATETSEYEKKLSGEKETPSDAVTENQGTTLTYSGSEAKEKDEAAGKEKTAAIALTDRSADTREITPAAGEGAAERLPVGEGAPRDKAAAEVSPEAAKISPVKYTVWLFAALLALCTFVVYSIGAADYIAKSNFSVPAVFLKEVFSSGLSVLPKIGGLPALPQIPGDSITPGESSPGAAEDETVGDIPQKEPESELTLPIKQVDISSDAENGFDIINETPYEPDLGALAGADSKIPKASELYGKFGSDAPLVLILHTHGSEAYSPEGADSYLSTASFRSIDPEETVIAVGAAMTQRLNARGVNAVHCTTMFDIEDYNSAYSKAAAEITGFLKEHPSVSYVFDVHRDALITSDGDNLRPAADIGGVSCAQLMLVVGTDHGGSGHTEWADNLSFAAKIQSGAHSAYPSLMRAVNLRSPSFNEQYTKGSLLIEVGAAGNSLNEAKRSAELISDVIADIIIGEK